VGVTVGVVALVAALALGTALGPVSISPGRVLVALLDLVPPVQIPSGLTLTEQAIVTQLRLPRVVLGMMVGALLGCCGAAYQGVFRNPLADPYLLGVASGAGLGAVTAISLGFGGRGLLGIPLMAFLGALLAVGLTYLLGASGFGMGGSRAAGPTTLILAGVAVSAFLSAVQTFMIQRHSETLQEVYSWLLGHLVTVGWTEVVVLIPYAVLSLAFLLLNGRVLDVLAVGDDEARTLGLRPQTARLLIVIAASLGTAAAVSFSGLIGFVGIIVPHLVRLICGHSYRVILPLSLLFGASLLVFADVVARLLLAPAEIPIGVVTAFLGAPFFLLVLRVSRLRGST